jgi:hypothetical protein
MERTRASLASLFWINALRVIVKHFSTSKAIWQSGTFDHFSPNMLIADDSVAFSWASSRKTGLMIRICTINAVIKLVFS